MISLLMLRQEPSPISFSINPFKPKCQQWYSPSLGVDHTIHVCRGVSVNNFLFYIIAWFTNLLLRPILNVTIRNLI